jgi:hypothetical protein
VLVELITGRKLITFNDEDESQIMTAHFISAMKDNQLSQILSATVIKEVRKMSCVIMLTMATICFMKITSNKSMRFSLKEELKPTIITIHEPERIKIEEQLTEYEAITCSVCLVELSVVSKAIQLPNPCSHVYHEECIMRWLN